MPGLVYIGPAVLKKEEENVKSVQRQQRQQLLRQRKFDQKSSLEPSAQVISKFKQKYNLKIF